MTLIAVDEVKNFNYWIEHSGILIYYVNQLFMLV